MGVTSRDGAPVARRVVDVLAASVLLMLAGPLLLLGALAVSLASGRPVFFAHRRVGLDGRSFRCWKLRTMTVDAEERLEREPELREHYRRNGFKLPASVDPRVTRVGRWLRRRHIDEIPQLLNVLNGTMSLVGPRPVVEPELVEYRPHERELLSIKPGVFGAWTSRGRARPPYPERARLELEYVRHRSLRRDLVILMETVPVLFRGQADE